VSVVYSSTPSGPTGRVSFGWIGEAFAIYRQQWLTWSGAVLLVVVASILIQLPFSLPSLLIDWPSIRSGGATIAPAPPLWASLLSLVGSPISICVSSFFYAGQFRMANKAVRGEPYSINDLFTGGPMMLSFVGYLLIFTVATLIGYVACCVGVLFSWILLWPGFAVLADGEDIGIALNRSFDGMKRDMWTGALFTFVLILLYLAGTVCTCSIGTLVMVPMMFIIGSLAYRDTIGFPGSTPFGEYPTSQPQAPGVWPPPPSVSTPPQRVWPPQSTPPPPPQSWPDASQGNQESPSAGESEEPGNPPTGNLPPSG
jgi:hypothetical protein